MIRRWPILLTVGLFTAIAGLYLVAQNDPADTRWYPRCWLHALTGLHCPGCGSTRSLHALTHGRITDAFRFNPLLLIGLPTLAMMLWHDRHLRRSQRRGYNRLGYIVLGVLVVFFAMRNIPSPQSSWFAPPVELNSHISGERQSRVVGKHFEKVKNHEVKR